MKITMVHGSGGKETSDLIGTLFMKHLRNTVLERLEDSAVLPGARSIAVTTDSFVVTPLFFPGGDIGKLAVCGTVNDLAMSGSTPKYLTCGFILEEGADTEDLERIVRSMAEAAAEAGVIIVAGDTKVIEGKGGIYINTSGVGVFPHMAATLSAEILPAIGPMNCKEGDAILLSGTLGDHHATILSARMGIANSIQSDCAPLCGMAAALCADGVKVRMMRDVTRGGLATVLNEAARASSCRIEISERKIPVSDAVRGFCGILGLDPLYMANEGKMIAVVEGHDAAEALRRMKESPYGKNAAVIGEIVRREDAGSGGEVVLHTAVGGCRILPELYGEGLPRIC